MGLGEVVSGFELVKKEYVESKSAELYTMRHVKSGAELLYFDRPDENKTFAIGFKTLPEDSTGVFHILEHSVLNGSKKYPAKEPFVSLLQSSMQTFLNAFTFWDKTMYPVSSRNDKDFFNLMAVYLDAVFCPMIYERPEIFMQEGWHYEFDSESAQPYYNGVVFSEMKGAYSEVDDVIEEETAQLLFPDNSYGFSSGGHPEHIPELTYRKFVDTHRRFYHPSNSKIILDGHMDLAAALKYMDEEYLSKYNYQKPDFDFVPQEPKIGERTVYYGARAGEEDRAHMVTAKILCNHDEVEKTYAAQILADYLAGSNEAPIKRAFLEKDVAQDISLSVVDGIYQPTISLVARNTTKEQFAQIKELLPNAVNELLEKGLDKEALRASLERFAFTNREISEPYGVELAVRIMSGWLYGDDPMTHVDNASVFASLREKLDTDYFEKLLAEILGDASDKSYLYVLPSLTKSEDDAAKEAERLAAITSAWDENERLSQFKAFERMQKWQQSEDSEETIKSLPHLELADVPVEVHPVDTELVKLGNKEVLRVNTETNGIVYTNLFFDVSDLTVEELRVLNLLADCFGELRTENLAADKLQSRIKATFGSLTAKISIMAKTGELKDCKPYFVVSASMLEENTAAAFELLNELLLNGKYDEVDRINETIKQGDYFMRQSLIGNGHSYAVKKALSAFSAEGALDELLDGESFVNWFSQLAVDFEKNSAKYSDELTRLSKKVFAAGRLFAGFGGNLDTDKLSSLISALPEGELGEAVCYALADNNPTAIEIPASVGYSAFGCNLYAIGSEFTGACSVLSSLMTFSYLWNMVRVQGGAYGTGMNVRANGDLFCYSYRDPNLPNTRTVYDSLPGFLEGFIEQGASLNDVIISTVNTTDPLLSPSGVCTLECTRYLKGITPESIAKIRREILATDIDDLKKLLEVLNKYIASAKYCAVGDKNAVAFVTE